MRDYIIAGLVLGGLCFGMYKLWSAAENEQKLKDECRYSVCQGEGMFPQLILDNTCRCLPANPAFAVYRKVY